MPDYDPRTTVDRSLTLPATSPVSFWLAGSTWELPAPHNADVFVERLVRAAGLLVHDPVAAAAVKGDVAHRLDVHRWSGACVTSDRPDAVA